MTERIELDEHQQKAVDDITGPMLVVAGPGSGKTRVLTQKVIKMVEAGIKPESILCVTFTEKAAKEMEARLYKNGISNVTASTFHSFAFELLKETMMDSQIGPSTRVFKRPATTVWCIRAFDSIDIDAEYINIKNNNVDVYEAIVQAIANFKEEMIEPSEITDYAERVLSSSDSTDEQKKDAGRMREFAKVYSAYNQHCRNKNLVDYSDMVLKAVQLLNSDKVILEHYRGRFTHILVDEFQDNNYSQFQLVNLLASHRNITVVGDDDQCIMRFQGAFLGIFDDFKREYGSHDLKESLLQINYRSTANIVRLANQFMKDVHERNQKTLEPHKKEDGDKVTVVRTPTETGQYQYIVDEIRDRVSKKQAEYRDIAILSRRRMDSVAVADALVAGGIPVSLVGEVKLFLLPVIKDVLAYMRIASDSATAGREIYRLLRRIGITDQNIARITGEVRKTLHENQSRDNDRVMDAVRNYQKFGESRALQTVQIQEFAEHIDSIKDAVPRFSMTDLVWSIMVERSDLYKRDMSYDSLEDRKNIDALNMFYDMVKEYEEMNSSGSLADLLDYIDVIENMTIEVDDDDLSNSVRVMTVHKSKGQEFSVVFVTDLTSTRFPSRFRTEKFPIPQELLKGLNRTVDNKELHREEERRLLYVGVTRAKEKLYLLFPKKYAKNKGENKPSEFLTDMEFESNPLIEFVEIEPKTTVDAPVRARRGQVAQIQENAAKAISSMSLNSAVEEIIRLAKAKYYDKHKSLHGFDASGLLSVNVDDIEIPMGEALPLVDWKNMTLSATSAETYEKCPLQFKFSKILKLPGKRDPAADIGSSVHAMIEEVSRTKDREAPTVKGAMASLNRNWHSPTYRSNHVKKDAENKAENIVKNYVEWENCAAGEIRDIERKFTVNLFNITFRGKIDRLVESPDGKYEVIDFKTGSKPSRGDALKRHRIQLCIYAKAVEDLYGSLPASASLVYLQDSDKREYKYEITQNLMDETLGALRRIIDDIRREEFAAMPGDACRICSYCDICDDAHK